MGIEKVNGEWCDLNYGGTSGLSVQKFEAPRTHRTGVGSLANLGIGPGRITMFGAPPKFGKTDLVTQLAVDALCNASGVMAVIANAEMSPTVLAARQVARLSGVPLERFTAGNLTPEIENRVTAAKDSLRSIGKGDDMSVEDDFCDQSEGAFDTAIQFLDPPYNTLNLVIALGGRRVPLPAPAGSTRPGR